MIRRSDTYDTTVREKMRGGSGSVTIEHFWKEDELLSKTRLCARLSLEPGSSIGFHEHAGEEEIFIVLSGQGRVNDAGVESVVKAGDTILTGNGAGHSVEAIGDEPLRLVAMIVEY
jgi:mannose-6-phosphate isomerase-like protein (cupin superfamily)